MALKANSLATIFWLLCCCLVASGQAPSDVKIFQDFFNEKNWSPVETELLKATTSLDQAIEIGDGESQAKALKGLGLLHLTRTHDYEKAMDFMIGALSIEDSLSLKQQQAITYVGIARIFEMVADHDNSSRFLEQALSLNDEDRDIHMMVMILNDLGKVNASRGKLNEALKNYEDVLKYREDIDRRVEAEALFNLGHLNTIQGRYKDALIKYKQALLISRTIGDKRAEAVSLNDIGELYQLMENAEKSMANHQVALEIRQALNDKRGIAESYNNIGGLFFKQEDTEKAITKALIALENGRESQDQEQIFKSYELLSQAYKHREDFKNALTYKELSVAINDFMENESHERQLLETQNRYVIGKKETQIEKLEALRIERENQIATQKKTKNFLIVLISLSLIIAVLILFLYISKRRSNLVLKAAQREVQQQNLKLQELNGTKDKFFSIISHDLKGPLNSLTSFSHLLIDHTDSLSKEDIQMLARDLDKSVKNLFALLENLLEWSRSQTGNIDFTPEVFDLAEILKLNQNLFEPLAKSKDITLAVGNNPQCLVQTHKHSINTVVRNLVSNAIKFTNPGGEIKLDLLVAGNGINVSVTDTGLGMSQQVIDKLFRLDKKYSTNGTANEKGTGLGLILCKDFIEKNGGQIRVTSEPGKGSVFSFSLPQTLSTAVIHADLQTTSII